MDKDPAPAIRCPGCGSASFIADPDSIPICEYCHVPYAPPGRQCSVCGASYQPGARRCPSCSAELLYACPVCGTLNPLAARQCLVCQQALDVIDEMFARLTRSTTDQLRRAREVGAEIKAREEAASEARLARMWVEEDRRRAELARAREERQRQERLMVTVAVGVVAIVIVVTIIVVIIISGSAPTFLFRS